jgi:sugar transferase (PEP-CTERM system associated)
MSSKGWIQLALFALDVIGLLLAHIVAYQFRIGDSALHSLWSGLILTVLALNIFCFYLFDLYQIESREALWKKPLKTIGVAVLAGCLIILTAYLSGAIEFRGTIGRGVLIGTQALFAMWAASHRFWFSKWMRSVDRRSRWIVLGSPEHLMALTSDLTANFATGQFLLFTSQTDATHTHDTHAHTQSYVINKDLNITTEGDLSAAENYLDEPCSGIIVCAGNTLPDQTIDMLMRVRLNGIRVIDLADFYEQIWLKVPIYYLQRSWFAMSQGFHLLHNPVGLRLKRICDASVSAILLILSSPAWLLAMLAIYIESPGSVIFKQTRVGENGQLFTVLKLRSMRLDAEKNGARWAEVKDSRVTRVGAFIRATRIDELPQLINVLRGDMSFIGPRPERPEFTDMLEKEIPFYSLRHLLRPGVTGWAQVMYPYGASIEDAREKLQYDLFYIKNYSLLLDAAIVFKTVRVVLFGKGR